MLKRIFIAVVCPIALISANASAADFCPSLANGKWLIASAKADPVTAMSNEEAHAFIGQRVIVSEHKVVFGKLQCDVVKEVIDYSSDDDLKEFEEYMEYGYNYGVVYSCRDEKIFIPGFSVGKSCDKILSGLDGWTFILRRLK